MSKQPKSWIWPAMMLVCCTAVFLLIHAGIRLGSPIFGSETGIFDAVVSVLTLAALVLGGYGAFVSYGIGQETLMASLRRDQSDRFKAGAELVSSDGPAAVMAGVALLKSVAREDPVGYLLVVINVYRSMVSHNKRTEKQAIWDSQENPDVDVAADDDEWPACHPSEAELVGALADLATEVNDANDPFKHRVNGRIVINNVYVRNQVFYDSAFRKIDFRHSIVDNCHFLRCDFSGSNLEFLTKGISFEDCNLTGAQLTIVTPFRLAALPDHLFFEGNNIFRGAIINGQDAATWIAVNVEPEPLV